MKSVYFNREGLTQDQLEEMFDVMIECGGVVYNKPEDTRGYKYFGIDEDGDIVFYDSAFDYYGGVEVVPTPEALREALAPSNKGEWIAVDGAKALPLGSWLVEVKDKRDGKVSRHVAVKRENVTLVGSHFHFDMAPVISYYNVEVYSI